ncbi:MAG: transcriptional regulator [Ruminococcaceae bacterium]|nr:transcriptional regulator [Oscillospiraceae bacterium]
MDKIDYKKAEKHLYLPKNPAIVQVPEMVFFAVDGQGDPNISPAYAEAMEILYGLSFTVKMSKMSGEAPEGYFEYVVPPLEGVWWTKDPAFDGKAPADKSKFFWTSMIRQPDFVTEEIFLWARERLAKKKPDLDLSKARLWRWEEGLCAHLLHIGPYDAEPASIEKLEAFVREQNCEADFTAQRRHHEIYLGDPRRTAPEKLKTVIRHPIKRRGEGPVSA